MRNLLNEIIGAGARYIIRRVRSARRHRQLRDQLRWDEFDAAGKQARQRGYRIGKVIKVSQAEPGAKAWVQWIGDTGHLAEFSSIRTTQILLQPRSIIVVSGSYGHEEHQRNVVYYVNKVEGHLNVRDYLGWLRHERRRQRRAAGVETNHVANK